MKCCVCGSEFSSPQPKAKTCSQECKKHFERAYQRRYHAANLDRFKGYARSQRAKHGERINARRRENHFWKGVEEALQSEGATQAMIGEALK